MSSVFYFELSTTFDIIFHFEKTNRSCFSRGKFYDTSTNLGIINWQKSGFVRPGLSFYPVLSGLVRSGRTGAGLPDRFQLCSSMYLDDHIQNNLHLCINSFKIKTKAYIHLFINIHNALFFILTE
jgi:hypothetical protein